MIKYEDVKNDKAVRAYIKSADESLRALGFTEHSFAHVGKVADVAGNILFSLGHSERAIELARIAGLLHDIGNVVNRVKHSQSGALMAFRILDRMGMEPEEIAEVVTAIGNHDEGEGVPVSDIAAALILADKSDVRRSRVRQTGALPDIHDRVNSSVDSASLLINKAEGTATLVLTIDTEISSVMEYFEIFLGRMVMCRKAAERLGLKFAIEINGQKIF
ncbi:MAG: HD domain-containing protein [Clostridia bacterium]|nr:HD domain-containing protein [Clostridia bacterium]